MSGAAEGRQRALLAARSGDHVAAARLFAEVTTAHPGDAALLNSAGSYHAGAGQPDVALSYYDRALRIDPGMGEAAINRAVVLGRLGRPGEAAAALAAGEALWQGLPRYWTARASAEMASDDRTAAARSYDRLLGREPRHPRALAGRARVAIERGEPDASARHRAALAQAPGDAWLLLGLAQSLVGEGRPEEALGLTAALAAQRPPWLPGMEAHADLALAMGAGDRFCDHYAAAANGTIANDPAFFLSWAAQMSGVQQPARAADIVARGRRLRPEDHHLALAEAAFRDAAGDLAGASALFEAARPADPDAEWLSHEARHHLRRDDPVAAERLLEALLVRAPDHVTGWSLRGVAWRAIGDTRVDWLLGQSGLVAELRLGLSEAEHIAAVQLLNGLHDRSSMPVGQSIRSGSQTRGALFHRMDPELGRVREAICDALDVYRSGLPPADRTHPLLRHRDRPWRIAGSWSIRMDGAGHHSTHVHPEGIISSASYFDVPEEVEQADRPGWLELGHAPDDLGSSIIPLRQIKPRRGHLVLFPSMMFHGTRPIANGRRLTIAFDVAG